MYMGERWCGVKMGAGEESGRGRRNLGVEGKKI